MSDTPDLTGLQPDPDKWSIEEYDPALDDPPIDHHHQGDEDPPAPEED